MKMSAITASTNHNQINATDLPDGYLSGWRCAESKSVFSNSFIEVFDEVAISPAEQACTYGRVHFKRIGVGVVVRFKDFILMVGQRRYPIERFSWEIPEGGTDNGNQDPLEAAVNEVAEETGLVVHKGQLTEELRLHTSNSATDEMCIIYRTVLEEESVPRQLSSYRDETIIARWFTLKDCLRLIMEGWITDAVSVAGILNEFTSFAKLQLDQS